MREDAAARARQMVDEIYRADSRRALATLIRLLGDFDLTEEALQDAFAAAVEQWPRDGVTMKPQAWLVSTGRFKAIDAHARAAAPELTDWAEIVGLYDLLVRADPSPVVELNRAVAVAMRDGPAAGVVLIDAILARGDLADYHLAHAARGDLYRRLGRAAEARASYERALNLTRQEPERRCLERRLSELRA